MSFKNALKNLVAHFGAVWSLLLYIVIFAAVISGLSLPFVMPVARAFADAGVFELFRNSFASIFGGEGLNGLWNGLYDTYKAVGQVFTDAPKIAALTRSFVIFIVVLLFRFFLGLYEIPFATVIDGQLSSNARFGLGGKFFSTLTVSVRYSLCKLPYTVAFDLLIFSIVYGLGHALGMSIALPFAVMLVMLVLLSLRFSVVACWAPSVASGERGVPKGFVRSASICFKRFGSIYSTYLMSLMLLFVVGAIVALLTLGVGMIIVLPFSAAYISYLNATVFYVKTGKRFYVDGEVFTPSTENVM